MPCIEIKNAASFLDDEADSRRNFVHIVRFWDEMRAGRRFPTENDICPSAVGDLWDSCYVIQKRDVYHPERGNYTYIGTNIVAAYEKGLLDSANGRVIAPKDLAVNGRYKEVMESGVAIYEEDEFIDSHGDEVKFRQCFLPLATHGEGVDGIFGCMHFMVEESDVLENAKLG